MFKNFRKPNLSISLFVKKLKKCLIKIKMFMKKNFMSIIVLILFLGFGNALFGQSITGKVVDKETGTEIIGAVIVIDGTTNGTVTDFDGTFSLACKVGEQTVKISYVGYLEETVKTSVSEGAATDLGTIKLGSDAVGLDELLVVASYAQDRKTPVSISTIQPEVIMEKLGSQEYPEILKSTPSVYTTKTGGGYGDGRINLRGFDSNNIGVLINGVPVNDMESGKVYWSNWAGLSDVTRTMQVQRGLGASKLAISSVGGTINIITKSTDAKKGGSVFYSIGNDNYVKKGFTISTGLMENGWAVTASGSQTTGDGYINGTNFDAYSYFLNISKRIGNNQSLSLTAFGAPQWHNQRSSMHLIEDYLDNPDRTKYNSNFGYLNGDVYSGGYAYNKYHKPQISLNHYWDINEKSTLSTALYASISSGGGRRVLGASANWLNFQYPSGLPYAETLLTDDGHLDLESAIQQNAASANGSQAVVAMSNNSHDWYGILSTLNTKVGNINFTGGIDGRYYKGYHYQVVDDLLGGKYYLDTKTKNLNRPASTPLYKGDKIGYYNLGEVLWEGVFLQGEYVTDQLSGFISLAGSNTSYRRVDFFAYEPGNQESEWVNFIGYSAKGGVNYNINKAHNIFANGGYFIRAPYFTYVFKNYSNEINTEVKHERVNSAEIGYGYKTKSLKADLTVYRTQWLDKALTRSIGNETGNITGLNATHQGVELVLKYSPAYKVDFRAMVSVGDWKWDNDVNAAIYDVNLVLVDSVKVYAGGLHVGDAAQTTAALGFDAEIFPKFKIGLDYNYYADLFAQFDITGRTKLETKGVDAWKLPNYHLMDFNLSYKFKLGKLDAGLYGKVNNILDTEYISDAMDGGDALNSPVYYGFGRTWTLSLSVRF